MPCPVHWTNSRQPSDPPQDRLVTIINGEHWASWQSSRLELLPHMHKRDTLPRDLFGWTSNDHKFIDFNTGLVKPREHCLYVLLQVACIIADLVNIHYKHWDERSQLRESVLVEHADELYDLFRQWAARQVHLLADTLAPKGATAAENQWMSPMPDLPTALSPAVTRDPSPSPVVTRPPSPSPADIRPPSQSPADMSESSAPLFIQTPQSQLQSSRATSTRAPPDAVYTAAARCVPTQRSVLQRVVQSTFAPPQTEAEERRQVGHVVVARAEQQGKQNLEVRTTSRKRNLEEFGTPVRPPQPAAPRLTALPDLPEAVELPPAPELPPPPRPTKPRGKGKQKAIPHQSLAYVAPKPKPKQSAGDGRGRKPAQPKGTGGGRNKGASKSRGKKPLASDSKRVAQGSSDEEAAEEEVEALAAAKAAMGGTTEDLSSSSSDNRGMSLQCTIFLRHIFYSRAIQIQTSLLQRMTTLTPIPKERKFTIAVRLVCLAEVLKALPHLLQPVEWIQARPFRLAARHASGSAWKSCFLPGLAVPHTMIQRPHKCVLVHVQSEGLALGPPGLHSRLCRLQRLPLQNIAGQSRRSKQV